MALPVYAGYPLWLFSPEGGSQQGQASLAEIVGDTYEPSFIAAHGPGGRVLGFDVLLRTRSERWAARQAFRELRGREALAWVVTYHSFATLAANATSGSSTLDIEDAFETVGYLDRVQHAWANGPGLNFGFEMGEPETIDGFGDRLRVGISPALPADLGAGFKLWGLALCRLSSDELSIRSTGGFYTDPDGEVHEVAQARLDFVESVRNTPTAF